MGNISWFPSYFKAEQFLGFSDTLREVCFFIWSGLDIGGIDLQKSNFFKFCLITLVSRTLKQSSNILLDLENKDVNSLCICQLVCLFVCYSSQSHYGWIMVTPKNKAVSMVWKPILFVEIYLCICVIYPNLNQISWNYTKILLKSLPEPKARGPKPSNLLSTNQIFVRVLAEIPNQINW